MAGQEGTLTPSHA